MTTSIPAVLAALTPTAERPSSHEGEPLLRAASPPPRSAMLAGFVGLASGLGALIAGARISFTATLMAVFGVLRLPPALSGPDGSITEGLTSTFYILVIAELGVSIIATYFLTMPERPPRTLKPLRAELARLGRGLQLARTDATVALACASSFSSRASAIAVSQLIPTFVAAWYLRTGRCHLAPEDTIKTGCRPAFALASSITGTIQLVALLAAPFVGFGGSRRPQRVPAYLLYSALAGLVGFVAFSALPDGDPRQLGVAVPASVLIGLSEIASTVLGLSLCGTARHELVNGTIEASDDAEREVGGAIAGVYSLSGAIGILFVSKLGGALTESRWRGAPFALVGATDLVLAVVAIAVVWRARAALD